MESFARNNFKAKAELIIAEELERVGWIEREREGNEAGPDGTGLGGAATGGINLSMKRSHPGELTQKKDFPTIHKVASVQLSHEPRGKVPARL